MMLSSGLSHYYKDNNQLIEKVQSYHHSQKQQIFHQILQRRSSELKKELPALIKRKELAERNLKKMKQLENNTQSSEQKLEGLTLQCFNESFHFSYEKGRQSFSSQQKIQQEELTCSICMELIEEKISVSEPYNCRHIYHSLCIENWFITKPKPQCPYCRSQCFSKQKKIMHYVTQIEELQAKIETLEQRQAFLTSRFCQILLNK